MILKPSKTENINFKTPLKVWDFPETYLEPALAFQSSVPICIFVGTVTTNQHARVAPQLILVNTSDKGTEKDRVLLLFRLSEGFGPFRCVRGGSLQ